MVLEDAWKLETNFGKRVRALRTLKGIPQRQMARFDLKQAYMASIEGGTVLSPSREMIEKIANTLEISPSRVNIKATTSEGLGFVGEGKGMVAYAIVLLALKFEDQS